MAETVKMQTVDLVIEAGWIIPVVPANKVLTDCAVAINKGKIVADGTADTLRKQASSNVITRLQISGADLGAIREKLALIPGVFRKKIGKLLEIGHILCF